MNPLIFYALHFIGTIAVLTALISAFQLLWHPTQESRWSEKTVGEPRAFPEYNRRHGYFIWRAPPWWHRERLFYVVRAALTIIGTGYFFYGAFLQVLSWMPYSWRKPIEDGDSIWAADYFAGTMALLLLLGIAPLYEQIIRRLKKYDQLQIDCACAEDFISTLNSLTYGSADEQKHLLDYSIRRIFHDSLSDSERSKRIFLLRLIHTMRSLPPSSKLFDSTSDVLRKSEPAAEKYGLTNEAANLMTFVRRRRYVDVQDHGEELQKILKDACEGKVSLRLIGTPNYECYSVSVFGCREKEANYVLWEYRLMNTIILADQFGAVGRVDDYFRNHCKWIWYAK